MDKDIIEKIEKELEELTESIETKREEDLDPSIRVYKDPWELSEDDL